MTERESKSGLAAAVFILAGFGLSEPAGAREQEPHPAPPAHPECAVNLARAGQMKDIVSNALVRGLKFPAGDVARFLAGAEKKYETGPDLLTAAAVHFGIGEDVLAAKVEKYRHCNCTHPVESTLHPALRVDPEAHPECTVDLMLAGQMSDIVSNALTLGLHVPASDVRAFLDGADKKYEDGPAVLAATAVRFEMNEDALAAEVLKFKHVNCRHAGGGESASAAVPPDDGLPVSAFAKDVTLHVVLHELGHALIREFDLPVLGNEETAADAFATTYFTTYMPDRAASVLAARTTSLMIEATETPDVDWKGEHDDDARRAFQIAALAVAADPEKYAAVAAAVGMSPEEIEKARDYGAEVHRSWRRVLAPLWMPEGSTSAEARVTYDDDSAFLVRLCEDGLAGEIASALGRFDWHSQVQVRFVEGDGRAGWSRSQRAVTVHAAYVRRFVEQGARGVPKSD